MQRSLFVISLLFALIIPMGVSAQTGDAGEQLRQEFRAALLADPRAQSISEGDLNALVESLAEEAETNEAVFDFIPPILPETGPHFAGQTSGSWNGAISTELLFFIILASLACAGLLLWWLLHLHRCHALASKSD